MATKTAARDVTSEIVYLTRALKAPTLRESVARLAERAKAESWTHEEFLAACLQREVSARESHGGEGRIRAARFPARKSLEEFDFDHSRGLKREVIAHLGTLDFITAKENVVFLGPPGTGKSHLATGLAIRACQAGHRVLFATASQWVARLAEAHAAGRLQSELVRLGRYPLLVIDEVGYIPFEAEAANRTAPGLVEARLYRLDGVGAAVATVVLFFVLGRWNVAARGVQPSVVEPVDPFQGGQLDLVEPAPRTATTDQLGLVQADQRFGGRVVEGVSDAADAGLGADLGEPLGVADRQVLHTAVGVVDQPGQVGAFAAALPHAPARARRGPGRRAARWRRASRRCAGRTGR